MLLYCQRDIIIRHLKQSGEWDASLVTLLHEILKRITECLLYLMTVVHISFLLMSRFRILLQSNGRHSNSVVCVVGMNILAFAASLLASTTPALYTIWLVQFCASYTPLVVNSSVYATLLSFYVKYAVRMNLKPLVIYWLCSLHYLNTLGSVPLLPCLPILMLLASVAVNYKLHLFLWLSLIYYCSNGDLFCPSVPIILLSNVIIVLWFVWIVGIRSLLKHKENILLIILVVCGDKHFLKPSSISLQQPPIISS